MRNLADLMYSCSLFKLKINYQKLQEMTTIREFVFHVARVSPPQRLKSQLKVHVKSAHQKARLDINFIVHHAVSQ